MANVEESDVAAECEYRKEKGVAKWHEKFLVEYRGGRKTEGRKCIKCNVLIKSIGASTTSMTKHTQVFLKLFESSLLNPKVPHRWRLMIINMWLWKKVCLLQSSITIAN